MVIHNSAAVGFSNAGSYDAHRPSYPSEAVTKLLQHLGLEGKNGARIIDLAAGTGKLTELLCHRPERFEVIAVEPHDKMRDTLNAKALKGVSTQSGTADNMGVEDGWADAVVVAQTFHWFANLDALREIRRVLRPEGKLAVIWNIDEYNKPRAWKATTEWENSLHELVMDAAQDGQPRFRDYVWKDVFSKQPEPALFSASLVENKTSYNVWLTKEALWERLATLSHVAMLDGDKKEAFVQRFDEILVEGNDGEWNDQNEILMHGVTIFAWTTKL